MEQTKSDIVRKSSGDENNGNKPSGTGTPSRLAHEPPSVRQIETLYPIDAKLLQYHFILDKVDVFLSKVQKLKLEIKQDTNFVIDPQTILLLSGTIFNINDNFYRRSEILQMCQKFNPSQKINLSPIISPISFDSLENIGKNSPVGPFGISLDKCVPLPSRKKMNDTLILLENLLNSVYDITLQRFESLLINFNNQHGLKETKSSIKEKLVFLDFDEIKSIDKFNFQDVPKIDLKKQEYIRKYYLTSQFQFLEVLIGDYIHIVDNIKQSIHNSIISLTKQKTQNNRTNPLFAMYTNLLRLADLYVEIRKIGKTIYFQNINYFQPYTKQRTALKATLSQMNILFTQSKQNGMLLSLISKYARRTEIKNLRMDFNIFVSEFRKVSLEMVTLLDKMIGVLKGIHGEFTLIVGEGKDSDFSTEYIRSKLRERANSERVKRLSMIHMQQEEMKVKLEHQIAGASVANNMSHINKRLNLVQAGKQEVTPQPTIVRRVEHRNITPNTQLARRASINGVIPAQSSSRLSSLKGSSHSPFYRPNASGSASPSVNSSRSNSLTRTDGMRQIARKVSLDSLTIGSISEDGAFVEPPKIGEDGVVSSQSTSSQSSTPTSSKISSDTTKTPTTQNVTRSSSRSNSLTSSPSSRAQLLQRRGSVNLSTPPGIASPASRSEYLRRRASVNLSSPSNSTNSLTRTNDQREVVQRKPNVNTSSPSTSNSNKLVSQPSTSSPGNLERRRSVVGVPNEVSSYSKSAAIQANKNSTPVHLTAQQRLQQHIMKASRNGTMYAQQLQSPRKTPNSSTSPPSGEETPTLIVSPPSPAAKPPIDDLPTSPLNSLKTGSMEAQKAIKMQLLNRSRSGSDANLSNYSLQDKLSPSKPKGLTSSSPSPTKIRSRSNSASVARKLALTSDKASNSGSASVSRNRSRANSASSRQTLSRTNSVLGGNTMVYKPEDTHLDESEEKRVRFTGVQEYTEDEDAPTPQRMQKQIRQKWAAYKPLFRKLNSQEGLALKLHKGDVDDVVQLPSVLMSQFNGEAPPKVKTTLRESTQISAAQSAASKLSTKFSLFRKRK